MTIIWRAGVIAALICSTLGMANAAAAAVAPTPLPRPFARGQASFHPTRIAPYRFDDTIVRVRFDFDRGIVYGHETAIVRPKHGGLRIVPFNSLGIAYQSVEVNGKPARYAIDPSAQRINVELTHPVTAGARLAVDFRYRTQPQRGVYFIRADKGYPNVTPEIWTQGEMIDNRRWFPTWDEPNQKTPSELIVTVPRGWTVVANGYLKSRIMHGATQTWDWNAPRPKSTYLIAFAAGPLSEHHTSLGQATDGNVAAFGNAAMHVDSYVQPTYAGLNALCFGDTNAIVAYFQQIIGVKFPWTKYDQTTAERFTYGGMENASATIQTDRAIHPQIENDEARCDGLVAHELAHQWWGDDVSLADWSNTWINEGFAVYFQELWSEKRFGSNEFDEERYGSQQSYFDETKHYFRPIVDYRYNDPLDLFDASGYPRPAEVLHMLRYMYGDQRFFKALHDYLEAYQYKNADTHEFFTAIDKSLGINLDWFRREWFYRAAYPYYHVKQHYDPRTHMLVLQVTQKNHDGKPFRMPVPIEIWWNGGHLAVRRTVDRNEQTVRIADVAAKPVMVLFNADDEILAQTVFDKPAAELAYQAAYAPYVGDREWALAELTKAATKKRPDRELAMHAVRDVAAFDSFYGVRADAVGDAAAFDDAVAVRTGLLDKDKRVRIASELAASTLKHAGPAIVAQLERMTADPDPIVAGNAYAALGASKAPGAYEKLLGGLHRDSFRQAIAGGALRGLAALGDARAIPLLAARTAYGTPEAERSTAIVALAQLAAKLKQNDRAIGTLLTIVQHDPLITSRIAATRALGVLGDPRAIPVLERVQRDDSQQAVQDGAWNAILSIRDAVAHAAAV